MSLSDVERLHAVEQANRPIFSAAERAMVEALVTEDQPSFTAAMNGHAVGQWLSEKAEARGDHAFAGVLCQVVLAIRMSWGDTDDRSEVFLRHYKGSSQKTDRKVR